MASDGPIGRPRTERWMKL